MTRSFVQIGCLLAVIALLLAGCGEASDTPPAGTASIEAPGAADPAIAEAPTIEAPAATNPEVAIIEMRELNTWYRVALVDPATIADPASFEALARLNCEGMEVCSIGFWYDANQIPSALPAAASQLDHQVFAFGRTFDGTENVLWNCDVFPQFEAAQRCLPRRLK